MINSDYFKRCGAKEDWEDQKDKYPDARKIEPVEVYIQENSIYLVTTREWVDWLIGLSREIDGGK